MTIETALPAVAILVWLAIISWFDLRTKEVPHIVWVAVPLLVAALYRAVLPVDQGGNWAFAGMVLVVVMASCRSRLPFARSVFIWLPPIAVLANLAGAQMMYGVLLSLALWLGWELGWVGGADSLTGMALALIWPGITLVIALAGVTILVVILLTVRDLVIERKFRLTHQVPALPLFLLTAIVYFMI